MYNLIQIYLILLGISFTISAGVAFYLLRYRREMPGAVFLALGQMNVMIWDIGYFIELISESFTGKMIGLKMQYLFGIPIVPVFLFLSMLSLSRKSATLSGTRLLLLFVIPAITCVLGVTMDMHKYFYTSISLETMGNYLLLTKTTGPWFSVHVVYSYLLIASSMYLLARYLFVQNKIYRTQSVLLLAGLLIIWIANIAYVSGMSSYMKLDFTNAVLSILGLLLILSLYRYGLFELVPVAREQVIDELPQGVIVVDEKNRVLDVNPAAKRILGMPLPVGMSTTTIFEALKIDGTDVFSAGYTEFMYHGNIYELDVSKLVKNSDSQGKVITISDVTKQKQTEDELRKVNAEKDKFISIIAHDLKNPFFALTGFSEILRTEFAELGDEEKMDIINKIHSISGETYHILQNLLDWSRSRSKRINYSPEIINISELAGKVAASLETIAAIKNIKIILNSNPEIYCYADGNMIRTVLRNLLSNAVKFSRQYGEIVLSCTSAGELVTVSVRDEGIGMPPELVSELMKGGEYESRKGTEGEEGTGFGMKLCFDFVTLNGGSLQIRSNPGRGSEFIFSLPTGNKST